jgi:hypothetical protein
MRFNWRRERDSNLAEACAASITCGIQKTFCPLQSPQTPGFGSRFGSSYRDRCTPDLQTEAFGRMVAGSDNQAPRSPPH